MSLEKIQIEFPADILSTLFENENSLKQEIKHALAIHLFLNKKITLGKASKIAGLSRLKFEQLLSVYNIPISLLEVDDVMNDLKKLG